MKKFLFPLLIVLSALVSPFVAKASDSRIGNDEKVFYADNSTILSQPSDDNGYRILEEFTEDDETNHSDDDTGHFDNTGYHNNTVTHHSFHSLCVTTRYRNNSIVAAIPVFMRCRVLRL